MDLRGPNNQATPTLKIERLQCRVDLEAISKRHCSVGIYMIPCVAIIISGQQKHNKEQEDKKQRTGSSRNSQREQTVTGFYWDGEESELEREHKDNIHGHCVTAQP